MMPAPAPLALSAACLASVAALLVLHRRGSSAGRVVAKLAASSCFVLVALSLGAHRSPYGQLILGALLLGWCGDALLLGRAARAFLGGLVAFLLSHLLFAAAFLSAGVSVQAMAAALAVALAVGLPLWRWLMPHTPQDFRRPVALYVVVILAMCAAAAGHAVAAQRWGVLVGAVMFAASDIAVARERFVRQGFVNQLWGWPAYFGAQLVLAWTVARHAT